MLYALGSFVLASVAYVFVGMGDMGVLFARAGAPPDWLALVPCMAGLACCSCCLMVAANNIPDRPGRLQWGRRGLAVLAFFVGGLLLVPAYVHTRDLRWLLAVGLLLGHIGMTVGTPQRSR